MSARIFLKNIYFVLRRTLLRLIPAKAAEENIRSEEIKSILVIRIDRIGDVVASLPALKALKEAFPQARLSILVGAGNDALLQDFPWIDEVIAYQGFSRAIRQLRQLRFDLAVDFLMDYPLKPALVTYLSRARLTAGFDIRSRGRFFNLKIKPSREKKHVSLYILDLAIEIVRVISGRLIQPSPAYPEIPLSQRNKEYVRFFLKDNGIAENDTLIGIFPGGHYPSQRWPVERFSRLADRIIERYNAKAVVVGSADDAPLVERMLGLMKERAVKAVGISLDKLAALIAAMDVFICNNSGPLHIACLVKTATVSTMGPTDPALWFPLGPGHIVLRQDLPCSPCGLGFCEKHSCMEFITVEEMENAVDTQLEGRIRK